MFVYAAAIYKKGFDCSTGRLMIGWDTFIWFNLEYNEKNLGSANANTAQHIHKHYINYAESISAPKLDHACILDILLATNSVGRGDYLQCIHMN